MNSLGETAPFLVQFESDIVNSIAANDSSDAASTQGDPKAWEGATKITRVRDETTDDD